MHAIPARQSTCCAFARTGLHRLYVTTATEGWTDEQRRAEPAAGLVYRLDTDATGRPAAPFRPTPPGGRPQPAADDAVRRQGRTER